MTTDLGTEDPEGDSKDKRGYFSLLVQVFEEHKIKGKNKSERIALESSLAGTDLEAPGKPRFLLREMQRTTAGMSTATNDSLELTGTISLQAVVWTEATCKSPLVWKS